MPLATGAEVRIADGKLSVVDPFVEAKEVIGGYAIFELPARKRRSPRSRSSCNSTRI
ncbi:MAG: hypothetical protein WBQ55_10020 [Xanthobacteraceae bacterium]